MALSRAKTFARPKKTPVLQVTLNKVGTKLNTPNNARRNALQLTHRLQINRMCCIDGIVVIPLLLY